MSAAEIAAEAIAQFRSALEQRGIIPPQHIKADGRLHRCDAEGRNGKWDAAYVLHTDGMPAGGFQNWRDGLGWQDWRADIGRELTAEEFAAHRRHIEASHAKRDREDRRRKAEAATKAGVIWREASPSADHPYLQRKGVKSRQVLWASPVARRPCHSSSRCPMQVAQSPICRPDRRKDLPERWQGPGMLL